MVVIIIAPSFFVLTTKLTSLPAGRTTSVPCPSSSTIDYIVATIRTMPKMTAIVSSSICCMSKIQSLYQVHQKPSNPHHDDMAVLFSDRPDFLDLTNAKECRVSYMESLGRATQSFYIFQHASRCFNIQKVKSHKI